MVRALLLSLEGTVMIECKARLPERAGALMMVLAMTCAKAQAQGPDDFGGHLESIRANQDIFMKVTDPRRLIDKYEVTRVKGKIVSDEKNLHSAYARMYYLAENHKLQEALAIANELIALRPRDAMYIAERGFIWMQLRKYDLAIKDCDRAITLDPKHHTAFRIRSYCYFATKQLEKGIADCNTLIAMDPGFGQAYYNRAKAYMRLGKKELAERDLATVRKLGYTSKTAVDDDTPKIAKSDQNTRLQALNHRIVFSHNSERSLLERAEFFARLGKWDLAIKDYQSVLASSPNSFDVRLKLVTINLELGRNDDALKLCIDPKSENTNRTTRLAMHTRSMRAQIYESMGKFDQAVQEYTSVINEKERAMEPDPVIYLWRASARIALKQPDAALSDCQKAISLDKGILGGKYTLGSIEESKGNSDSAMSYYDKAIAEWPEDTRPLARRGRLRMVKHDYQGAVSDLSRALLYPACDVVTLYEERAQCYDKLADTKAADADRLMVKKIRDSSLKAASGDQEQ